MSLWRLALFALVVLSHPASCGASSADDYNDLPPPDGPYDDEPDGYGDDDPYPPAPPPETEELRELSSVEALDAFLADATDASVIGAFTAAEIVDPDAKMPDGWDEEEDGAWEAPTIVNPSLASFKTIASALSYDYSMAYSTDSNVLARLKSKAGGIYLFPDARFVSTKHGDRGRERYPGKAIDEAPLSRWLASKAQPLVGQLTVTSKERYLGATGVGGKQPLLIVFTNLDFEKNAKGVAYVLSRARKVAAELKGKMRVAVAKASDYDFQMPDFGLTLKSASTDTLMGIQHRVKHVDKFYGDDAAFTAKNLQAFADKFLAGELTPSKTEDANDPPPPPPSGADDDEESPVVTLTETSFEHTVGDEDIDKMVEFYAPWCGHCKALAPEYAEAARRLGESHPNVVLAKFDATEHNAPPPFEISGYPTIYFVPRGADSTPVVYEGERTADAIVEYIEKHAPVPEGYDAPSTPPYLDE